MSEYWPLSLPRVPREGVCLDFVLQVIRYAIVVPAILALAPVAILSRLGKEVFSLYASVARPVEIFLGLVSIYLLSSWCSEQAQNNWVDDEYDWSKETVVITGGAGGIGSCLVREFLKMEATVIILDVQSRPPDIHPKVHYFQCDLGSYENVARVATKIRAEVGQPTVLINNAGVVQGSPLLVAQPSDIRHTFDVNTLAAIWTIKEFLPSMVTKNHGMLVAVTSLSAWLTAPSMVDYGASKIAMLSLHEGLMAELTNNYNAPKVRTVTVLTGHVKTALFAGFDQGMEFLLPSLQPETVAKAVVRQVVTGRSGRVVLPRTGSFLQVVRLLPGWLTAIIAARGGPMMKNFKGRKVGSG